MLTYHLANNHTIINMNRHKKILFVLFITLITLACGKDKSIEQQNKDKEHGGKDNVELNIQFTAKDASGIYFGRKEELLSAHFQLNLSSLNNNIKEGLVVNGISDMVIDAEDFTIKGGEYRIATDNKTYTLENSNPNKSNTSGCFYYKEEGGKLVHKIFLTNPKSSINIGSSSKEYTITTEFEGVDEISGKKAPSIKIRYDGEIDFEDQSTPIAYLIFSDCELSYDNNPTNKEFTKATISLHNKNDEIQNEHTSQLALKIETLLSISQKQDNIGLDVGYYYVTSNESLKGIIPGFMDGENATKGSVGFRVSSDDSNEIITIDQGVIKITKSNEHYNIRTLLSGINQKTNTREDIISCFRGAITNNGGSGNVENPEEPKEPDSPKEPEEPKEPDNPDPEEPENPDTPIPIDPEQPEEPDNPDPEEPKEPDNPDPETPTLPTINNIAFTKATASENWNVTKLELSCIDQESGVEKVIPVEFFMDEALSNRLIPAKYTVNNSEDDFSICMGRINQNGTPISTVYQEFKANKRIKSLPVTSGEMTISESNKSYIIEFEFHGTDNETGKEETIKGTFKGNISFR